VFLGLLGGRPFFRHAVKLLKIGETGKLPVLANRRAWRWLGILRPPWRAYSPAKGRKQEESCFSTDLQLVFPFCLP
jgi:hypothetical protein